MYKYILIIIFIIQNFCGCQLKAQDINCHSFFVDELIAQKFDTLTITSNFYFERLKRQEVIKLYLSSNGDIIANISFFADSAVVKNIKHKVTPKQVNIFRNFESMLDDGSLAPNYIGLSGSGGEYYLETPYKTKFYRYKEVFSLLKILGCKF